MQKEYTAMVEHAQGKQFTTIMARNVVDAKRRLKAKGYAVLSIGATEE